MNDAYRVSDAIFRLEFIRKIVAEYLAIKEDAARFMMAFELGDSPFTLDEVTAAVQATIDIEKLLDALTEEIDVFYADEFEAIEFWSQRDNLRDGGGRDGGGRDGGRRDGGDRGGGDRDGGRRDGGDRDGGDRDGRDR